MDVLFCQEPELKSLEPSWSLSFPSFPKQVCQQVAEIIAPQLFFLPFPPVQLVVRYLSPEHFNSFQTVLLLISSLFFILPRASAAALF